MEIIGLDVDDAQSVLVSISIQSTRFLERKMVVALFFWNHLFWHPCSAESYTHADRPVKIRLHGVGIQLTKDFVIQIGDTLIIKDCAKQLDSDWSI